MSECGVGIPITVGDFVIAVLLQQGDCASNVRGCEARAVERLLIITECRHHNAEAGGQYIYRHSRSIGVEPII